jgi:non-ribosomal peptide synthase protein (TIGR01720 family)
MVSLPRRSGAPPAQDNAVQDLEWTAGGYAQTVGCGNRRNLAGAIRQRRRAPAGDYDPAEKDLPATSRRWPSPAQRDAPCQHSAKGLSHADQRRAAAALAQASLWTGQQALLIDMEGHGREPVFDDVDLSRTVGWFTSVYPVLIDLGGTKGVGEALRSVKEQLRRIPARGLGYGVLRYLCDDSDIAAQLRALPPAQLSFNYLGQFGDVRILSSWEESVAELEGQPVSDESLISVSAEPVRWEWGASSHMIDINGGVAEGRLVLTWAFAQKFYDPDTIRGLAAAFVAALRGIIAHCTSLDSRRYTPSDFPLARLDQARLEWLVGSDRQIEDIYPLSPMQEGMLFHGLMDPIRASISSNR